MTQRLSDEIHQGLRIRTNLYNKIEELSVSLIKGLELYLQAVTDFKRFKDTANHFVDGGWAGTSTATFVLSNGWSIEFTSGRYVTIQNWGLDFLAKSGDHMGGSAFNPPSIRRCTNSVAILYNIDHSLDQFILDIYNKFTPLQSWFDDLKVRI